MLLQLLTQRKAIEKRPSNKNDVPLCRVLKKEGVLSNPERLLEKAQQVMSVLRDLKVLLNKHNFERLE